jgi:putative flippase GtrA
MRNILEKLGHWIKQLLELFYFPFIRRFIQSETYLYAATGGANLAFDFLLYYLFLHYIIHNEVVDFGFIAFTPHIAAFIFVFPITFATGFFLAKYVTFTASQLKGNKQLVRYAISVGGSILLNYILLKLFVEYMYIYPTPSKMITAIFVVIYSFLVQKFFTFQTGEKQLEKYS